MNDHEAIRLDKWLWHARFFKTRGIASRFCGNGGVRIDGHRTEKAHYIVRIGQVLTFRQASQVRVVKIVALGSRRGPAAEAAKLYEDLSDNIRLPSLKAVI
jgi:ribosome-associated heat shock protein Hsp15